MSSCSLSPPRFAGHFGGKTLPVTLCRSCSRCSRWVRRCALLSTGVPNCKRLPAIDLSRNHSRDNRIRRHPGDFSHAVGREFAADAIKHKTLLTRWRQGFSGGRKSNRLSLLLIGPYFAALFPSEFLRTFCVEHYPRAPDCPCCHTMPSPGGIRASRDRTVPPSDDF